MIRLADFHSYDDAIGRFCWPQPTLYNIASACCDDWAIRQPDRPALVVADERGRPTTLSYGGLQSLVNRCTNSLEAMGVMRGDRVAIHLGQTIETVVVHLAVYKRAAIAVPLAAVFGPEAIGYRMDHAGAKVIVTAFDALERLPALEAKVVSVGGGANDLAALMAKAAPTASTAQTGPDDPAMMIFTSGTTGLPKGALHGHRVLLGHLPGVQMHHDLMPQPGDTLWTPADWAWAGGLLNVLLPGLAMGVPVVAQRAPRFDPQEALDWAGEAGVRNAFIPPTALRMMRDVTKAPTLRSVGSGGEQLGAATFSWGKERLGVTINEFYGQTECNLVLSSASRWGIATPGVIGRAVPGHTVAVIDESGAVLPDGEQGMIAVHAPDPVMFLGYWDNEAATRDKFIGNFMTTGDQGIAGDEGIRFVGRDDDVINSAGYRIGPGEIESCLAGHPAVALCAVVGKPDDVRGEIVSAFIKLATGTEPNDALKEDIQAFVRQRLSAHEYPRQITFVADVPLTTTGKVIRRVFREGTSPSN
ncbi:MAG: AMP-binding protein [Pseudomonadota bacterium]